jgi:DNA modification methylase
MTGSGTTEIASPRQIRRFVGIDFDEKMYYSAKEILTEENRKMRIDALRSPL